MKLSRQDVLLYFAASNLYLLPFWVLAFVRNGMPTDARFIEHYYELSQVFDHVDYFAALLLALVMTAVFGVAGYLLGKTIPKIRGWYDFSLGICGFAMMVATVWILSFKPSGGIRLDVGEMYAVVFVSVVAALVLIVLAIIWRSLTWNIVRYSILSTSPIAALMLVNAIVAADKIGASDDTFYRSDYSFASPVRESREARGPRVVMLVFDMWDYPLTFERRPEWLKLPAIDRFATEAFNATQAYRTSKYTRFAFPGIVLGHKVMWSEPTRGGDLGILLAESTDLTSWRDHPGFFGSAFYAGYNTSVIAAAYHPYCRLFHDLITSCWSDSTGFTYGVRTAFNRMDDIVLEVARYIPGLRRLRSDLPKPLHEDWGVHLYFATRQKIVAAATDPDSDFLFAHVMLPHPPFIRDYRTGEYKYFDEQAPATNYFGNMQAMDDLIGELRTSMEGSSLWDDALVLLTSDHGYVLGDFKEYIPEYDPRVPFLLKLPGQKNGVVSHKPFMTTSIRSILEATFQNTRIRPEAIESHLEYPVYYH